MMSIERGPKILRVGKSTASAAKVVGPVPINNNNYYIIHNDYLLR